MVMMSRDNNIWIAYYYSDMAMNVYERWRVYNSSQSMIPWMLIVI